MGLTVKGREIPAWVAWVTLAPGAVALLAVLWRVFLFAVGQADSGVVERIEASFEHMEQHAQQSDGWLRCRSELLGRGADRAVADETCRQLFPAPDEMEEP